MVEYGAFDLVGLLEAIDGYIVKYESLYYDYRGANFVGYHYWVDRADIGVIGCSGMVGSGADDETKIAFGTFDKSTGYGLRIFFILSI